MYHGYGEELFFAGIRDHARRSKKAYVPVPWNRRNTKGGLLLLWLLRLFSPVRGDDKKKQSEERRKRRERNRRERKRRIGARMEMAQEKRSKGRREGRGREVRELIE